jgi:hypothetical protein
MITAAPAFTLAELESLLTQTDPGALLVPPRILRRVIKKDRGLGGLGLQVPHRKSYVIDRESLFQIADRSELGLAIQRSLPDHLILLPRPETPLVPSQSPDEVLLKFWRFLFHARAHLTLHQRIAAGLLTEEGVRQRIERIGTTAFAEAHAVLRQEYFLLPPDRPLEAYEEFTALYWELRYFARHRLAAFFPAVDRFETIEAVLTEDIDAEALYRATRLPGAPDPLAENQRNEIASSIGEETSNTLPVSDESASRTWIDRAAKVAARGNLVRAAILRAQAAQAAPAEQAEALWTLARQTLDQMADRLSALGPRAPAVEPGTESELGPKGSWREGLASLLEPAAKGYWSIEARLLYDLQKVCLDQEKDVYAVDLIEWAVSWGRRPIKRLLPNQWQVRMVKHLRSAWNRLSGVHLGGPERQHLTELLHAALSHSEEQLRDRLRPACTNALAQVGLSPENVVEGVARDKLVEELLDRVVEHGFLTMSDLRDALARNQLKLPDLAGVGEFFLGDRVIQANRSLAEALDGVYHRGEVYLRWLQRLSSTAFGTPVGRFLTRFLVLPFGGAFFVLMGLAEILGLIHHATGEQIKESVPYVCPLLGLFLLALLHVHSFRQTVGTTLWRSWRFGVWLCHDLPASILRLDWVRSILQSRYYLFFYQHFIKPLLWAALVGTGLYLAGVDPLWSTGLAAAVFVGASLLISSRVGLYLEEVSTDTIVRTWHLVGRDMIPGLFRLIMYISRRVVEDVERVIYTVDESLRFRSGDSRLSLYWKPVVGLVWFFFTYLLRVFVNLFAEPTFNPIKHFPVVTVAAKLLVPFIPALLRALTHAFAPIVGSWIGGGLATVILFFIPGLAGFLVWELKENWKLYAANRSPTLEPIMIGSHGETMLRFMKPGFHSGTLPKIYAKLRRKKGRAAHKQEESLHHVQVDLQRFLQRNLLAQLARSTRWGGETLTLKEIRTATNRVSYRLASSWQIDFIENNGQLLAQCLSTEPEEPVAVSLSKLGPEQVRALTDALAGWSKVAGADRVRVGGELVSFADVPIRWIDWVETWERDQAGKGPEPLLPASVSLLPVASG